MQQHTIKPAKSQSKNRKRIGRGNGSGHGTYSTRGVKGQTARSGGKRRPGFEGGQTPLIRRMPKLPGFRHPKADQKTNQVINLKTLETYFADGETVDKATLKAKSLIRSLTLPVKVLGQGELKKKLKVTVDFASASAMEAIKKAGGEVMVKSDMVKEDSENK